MNDFATVNDVIAQWRALTDAETTKVETLIPLVCSHIRIEGAKYGKDVNTLVAVDYDYANVVKSVTVDVVKRYINDNAVDSPAMTQFSQSAGGYSTSGTFMVAGGGLKLLESEKKILGFKRQMIKVIDYDFT